jgi:peptide alpha-N-acetyltransferase
MVFLGCEEITLETEASNSGALKLYEKLGFVRDEKLTRYYLNGGDAYRLKFWIDSPKSLDLERIDKIFNEDDIADSVKEGILQTIDEAMEKLSITTTNDNSLL